MSPGCLPFLIILQPRIQPNYAIHPHHRFDMPLPFGVSVGDFVACIGLIKDIIDCLQDSQGSAAKYRGLLNSLESLQTALSKVKSVETESREKHALKEAARQCGYTLSAFLAKIEKYQPSLKVGGSGSAFKDSLRKIQWAF